VVPSISSSTSMIDDFGLLFFRRRHVFHCRDSDGEATDDDQRRGQPGRARGRVRLAVTVVVHVSLALDAPDVPAPALWPSVAEHEIYAFLLPQAPDGPSRFLQNDLARMTSHFLRNAAGGRGLGNGYFKAFAPLRRGEPATLYERAYALNVIPPVNLQPHVRCSTLPRETPRVRTCAHSGRPICGQRFSVGGLSDSLASRELLRPRA
jgi:hypothetical protein